MKIGEYLKEALKSKNISVSELSRSLGLASRNELYRLFNGYHSYDKQKRMINAIIAQVPFSAEETKTLRCLLKKSKEGEFALEVKRILNYIYAPDIKPLTVRRGSIKKKLSAALCSHKGEKIIIASGIKSERVIQEMYDVLKKNPNQEIYNYMSFPQGDVLTAYEILALVKLAEFTGYIPLECDEAPQAGLQIIGTEKGKPYLQLLELADGEPVLIETNISNEMYQYMLDRNQRMKSECRPIKETIGRVPDYMQILGDVLEIDKGDVISSEGTLCFGYLPAEILCEMFEQINFFGYPKEHPYPQELMRLVRDREARLHSAGSRNMIFDEENVKNMLLTGISVDHLEGFPPMNPEQRARSFKYLIEYSKRHPESMRFRMLKDGTVEYPYAYEKGRMLYIYRSNTSDAGDSVIMLVNKNVNEVMTIFTDYVWETRTASDTETAEKLENMMKKYLGI
ncbi:MAG: hypothetical protein LIO53_05300 [Oscillospiraceae bacterium]|nr:hypothetical protein [Oscillospiraceae bacterium]